tara:strand:- start:760 stop:987 length:228 start_codon:yes stop_codon:yes gene_type:complete
MTVDVDRLRELSDAMLIEKHFGGDEPEPEERPLLERFQALLLEVSARLSDDRDYEDELRPRLRELLDYLEDTVEE